METLNALKLEQRRVLPFTSHSNMKDAHPLPLDIQEFFINHKQRGWWRRGRRGGSQKLSRNFGLALILAGLEQVGVFLRHPLIYNQKGFIFPSFGVKMSKKTI